jgi:hypothetical protein
MPKGWGVLTRGPRLRLERGVLPNPSLPVRQWLGTRHSSIRKPQPNPVTHSLPMRALSRPILRLLFVFHLIGAALCARAGTILQAPGSSQVAFEAEENVLLKAGAPTSFVITNDVTPSGDTALFAAGVNNTGFPSSFASYRILFTTAGQYKVYLRWRASEDYTKNDPNAGNSYHLPSVFNSSTEPLNPNPDYVTSSINNSRVPPAVNTYGFSSETTFLEVTQEQVDAGQPLVFSIGTREAGLFMDRFVLSVDAALSEAQFNATPNSDTDVFVQSAGVNYVAFEAESPKVRLVAGSPTSFVITNDSTPSGNQALFAAGVNNTGFPTSFASYSIRFSSAGTYRIYLRWRASEDYTKNDPNAGNSYHVPTLLNSSTELVNPNPDYVSSSINNSRVPPAVNTYGFSLESSSFEVTQEQIDAGQPLDFTIGTREAGLFIDRFVLSLDAALTEAQFNAAENTGAAVPPVISRAAGSASLVNVKIAFSKALDENTVLPGAFSLSGGLNVIAAALDPVSLKDVTLTTTPQTEGVSYELTVSSVADLSGNAIAPNSKTSFFAWKLVEGVAQRDYFFGITGAGVSALVEDPRYPNAPDRSNVAKDFTSVSEPAAQNYGLRLTAFFIPEQSGVYDFFMVNSDDAELFLSPSSQAEQLQSILALPANASLSYDPSTYGSSAGSLEAGQRYVLQVLMKQDADYVALVRVAARRQGDATPVEALNLLGGSRIASFVDPASARVDVLRQPLAAVVTQGRRARFEAEAASPGGPVYYQWQKNGANIPGATRAAYVTPVLGLADSGSQYRVILSGGGGTVPSASVGVTVNPGPAPTSVPWIGASFGGGAAGVGPAGILRPDDVVGVVPQANWNNLLDPTGVDLPLVDADGASTDIVIDYAGANYMTGTGEATAENVLFQGYLHNANGTVTATLKNVPAGNYHLIVYCLGFTYNASYEQRLELVGGGSYPAYTVLAEHAAEYSLAPNVFRRMSSLNPEARDHGNYVIFENVSPDDAGSLALSVINESTFTGVNVNPALNALQLVRVSALPPTLTVGFEGGSATVSWAGDAAGYVLESSSSLSAPVVWTPVAGVSAPIAGAGTKAVSPTGRAQFFRLRQ